MGYRSDVKIVIKFDTPEQMTAFAVAQRMKGDPEINRMFARQPTTTDWEAGVQDGNKMRWHYDGIKWYEGYPFIQAWQDLLREVEDDEQWPSGGWAFARTGEEIDDIHRDQGGSVDSVWEYISVYVASEFV